MALIRNVNIWDSRKTKPTQPRDFNPFLAKRVTHQRADMKETIGRFWDANPTIPIQRMKLQDDGTWIEVKDNNGEQGRY